MDPLDQAFSDAMDALRKANEEEQGPWQALMDAGSAKPRVFDPSLAETWYQKRQATMAAYNRVREAQAALLSAGRTPSH